MIFIPHNVPSLKNSKVATMVGKGPNKRKVILPSKTVKNYLKALGIKKYSPKGGVECFKNRPNLFQESVGDYFRGVPTPVAVKLFFIRNTRRKFDFHNAVQIIADLLVAHGYLEDDNMDCFIPMPMMSGGRWYWVDKNKPGVWLKRVDI